jgi:hypothetical protein
MRQRRVLCVETAFARLRAHAYATDRHLGHVAHDVVERRLRFETRRIIGNQPVDAANSSPSGHDQT